jgi:hypothetical protein
MRGDLSIPGKKGHLPTASIRVVESLKNPTPRLLLAVIDFPKIEHRPLDNLATPASAAFHNRPIPVDFAVFEPSCAS